MRCPAIRTRENENDLIRVNSDRLGFNFQLAAERHGSRERLLAHAEVRWCRGSSCFSWLTSSSARSRSRLRIGRHCRLAEEGHSAYRELAPTAGGVSSPGESERALRLFRPRERERAHTRTIQFSSQIGPARAFNFQPGAAPTTVTRSTKKEPRAQLRDEDTPPTDEAKGTATRASRPQHDLREVGVSVFQRQRFSVSTLASASATTVPTVS
jgi:hypothetical protein